MKDNYKNHYKYPGAERSIRKVKSRTEKSDRNIKTNFYWISISNFYTLERTLVDFDLSVMYRTTITEIIIEIWPIKSTRARSFVHWGPALISPGSGTVCFYQNYWFAYDYCSCWSTFSIFLYILAQSWLDYKRKANSSLHQGNFFFFLVGLKSITFWPCIKKWGDVWQRLFRN